MALEQRIESLRKRHAEIDRQLSAEEARPFPDEVQLHFLKCQKLFLKDEMSRLQTGFKEAA